MTAEQLEAKITEAVNKCLLAKTEAEHGPLWLEVVRLIGMRSPEQVAQMEREKGLA